VLENSRVTCPSQPGSKGVTLTIIPHLAYVDFPKQITKTSMEIKSRIQQLTNQRSKIENDIVELELILEKSSKAASHFHEKIKLV